MKRRSWVITGLLAGSVLAMLLVFAGCGGGLPKGAIAQVGQTPITQDRFDELIALYESAGRAPDKDDREDEYEKFKRAIAGYLVVMQVLEQEAASYNISVTDGDVDAEIAKIKEMFQGDEKKFEAALKEQHLSLEQLAEQTHDRLLLDRMKAAVMADVTVTEAEAKAYYEANKAEYVQPEERETRHILIAVEAAGESGDTSGVSQAQWDEAKVEAEKIRALIQNGADFASTAEKYSDDETTKESGGELGAITRGQLEPLFEDAVFGLKKGAVSEPVKTEYGYHIVQVTDITPSEQLSYDQVKEDIKTVLLEQKTDQTWEAWLAEKEKALGVTYGSGLKPEAVTTMPPETASADEGTADDAGSSSTNPGVE